MGSFYRKWAVGMDIVKDLSVEQETTGSFSHGVLLLTLQTHSAKPPSRDQELTLPEAF